MNSSEATSGNKATEEVWHVQLASGELRVMTLDQLDDAFQNGLVSENTFVYQSGMNDWIKLADLAGLDGDGDETPAEGSHVDEDLSVAMADDDGDGHAVAPAPPSKAPPALGSPPPALGSPPPALGSPPPAPSTMATASMSPPAATLTSFPPAPIAAQAPVLSQVTAPPAAASFGPFAPPISMPANPLLAGAIGPNSTAPVAADKPDLEFDTDLSFSKRKSSRGKWVLAAAALGAVAVAGVGMSQGWFARPSTAAALDLPPLPAAAPTATSVAENTPPPAAEPAPKPTADRLSDDTRRALADADKNRAEKARARQRVVRTAAPRSRPTKNSGPFHKGGNPHDPLNSSL